MPIINWLLEAKANVIIGGDGRSLELLKQEYPSLPFIELPSYNVQYPKDGNFVMSTLMRSPIYLNAVRQEYMALQDIIDNCSIDVVISDNRYGLWTDKVPCVFIGHQIVLQPSERLKWATPIAYRMQRLFLDRFDEVWIPDNEKENSIAGDLVHQYPLTKNMKLMGALSRFEQKDNLEHEFGELDIVCVLSGPEPQRSLLEYQLKKQLKDLGRSVLIVQGKTETYEAKQVKNITKVSYLTSETLHAVLQQAKVIISRTGYSTVMDLYALGKKAILIPTPGQTEQILLGEHLAEKDYAIVQQQDNLDIPQAIEQLGNIKGFPQQDRNRLMSNVLASFFHE